MPRRRATLATREGNDRPLEPLAPSTPAVPFASLAPSAPWWGAYWDPHSRLGAPLPSLGPCAVAERSVRGLISPQYHGDTLYRRSKAPQQSLQHSVPRPTSPHRWGDRVNPAPRLPSLPHQTAPSAWDYRSRRLGDDVRVNAAGAPQTRRAGSAATTPRARRGAPRPLLADVASRDDRPLDPFVPSASTGRPPLAASQPWWGAPWTASSASTPPALAVGAAPALRWPRASRAQVTRLDLTSAPWRHAVSAL